MHLLVIEKDEESISRLALALKAEGCDVDTFARASELAPSVTTDYDGIIADATVQPRRVCRTIRELRRAGSRSPVLLLTRNDSADEICRALDAGADDYVAVPADIAGVLVRMHVLARRTRRSATLRYGDLKVDRIGHVVTRDSGPVELTSTEFRLLEQLLLHATVVVTRAELQQSVWAGHVDPGSNVVDVHMANLRRKLESGGGVRLIHTIRGAGYLLQACPPDENTVRPPGRGG